MNSAIGRLGHEVSGEYVTHEEANRMFDEAMGNTGFLHDLKQAYVSVRKYFNRD